MSEKAAATAALTTWYPEVRRGADPQVLEEIGYTPPENSIPVYRAAALHAQLEDASLIQKEQIRAKAVADIEHTQGLTGSYDQSPAAIAARGVINQRGRALAEKAIADHLAQKTE